jgi:Family of unknown function (DUF5343)
MGLMATYLIKTSNLPDFFTAIRNAQAPERFTQRFLKDLEFDSSTDRQYIGVLKGLGLLDEGGGPTERYFEFLDPSRSGVVLASAIREAYGDLFAIKRDAEQMELEEIRGKLKTLTRGQKSENVINWMASTFRALCDFADWSQPPPAPAAHEATVETEDKSQPSAELPLPSPAPSGKSIELHYNIQLILPEARDQAVYDALFASLRRHLL